jgi:V/A-type H+/Na+-transporting ATPase subunit I
MIIPMSKFSFLVFHKDYQVFLDQMREFGVLHLIEKQHEISDDIREQYDLVKQIVSVIKSLERREVHQKSKTVSARGEDLYKEVVNLQEQIDHKVLQLNQLNKEISQIKHWGDFSTETIRKLEENNVFLKFFTVSSRKFQENWLQEYPIEILSQHSGLTYFVLAHDGTDDIELDAEEMRPPEKPISELNYYREELEKDIDRINEEIDQHASGSLQAIKQYRLEVIEHTVKEADDKVMLLEGWVPVGKEKSLLDYLETNNILYVSEKPGKEEKVPVLLKNKKFSEKFEMLGELYSLPKYNELDLTPFFAPFYMLFFGFCLGDAGYGLLMVAAALLLKKKVKKQLRNVLGLVFYLGLSTILFGIIGGTAFGIPLYETSLPVYKTLAQKFAERDTDINQLLFYLALLFGGTQILFGMFLKVINEIRQFGWGFAIGTIGWITLLIGGITIYLTSRLTGIPMEQLNTPLYILLGISGLLILPLNNLGRNMFMNVGVGLWNTYNMVTGILGDLLSYIRLFALGISSAIMGFVFNSLAIEMSGSIPVLNILIMVVILVIGHGINIFMSGLGAFVHPMRLTFVEFYKNAGFSGGGKQYNPFRKIT